MLKELHISNYRLFDDLTIPELGQVNLIAGKNNTGKTALLEALRIWAAKGDNTVVNHVLKTRGEFTLGWNESYDFFFPKNQLAHSEIEDSIMISIDKLSIIRPAGKPYIPTFQLEWGSGRSSLDANSTPDNPRDQSIFVPFNNPHFPLQYLWEKIVLTPSEQEVLEILRILEPRLQRIDVKEDNSKVLLEGDTGPVSLNSLGEGMSRLLWLAVALVSAKESKLLLIDEFEAGLHHSIQETLWEKVFHYAKEWNIQVFVTTHSMDTVRTFYYVAAHSEYEGMGKFFRLQRSRKGTIEVKNYDEERLEKVLELKMELR